MLPHINISVHRSPSSPHHILLHLLDLLFSLVRVCLMPLSMLIVHCSKAAFITMIKHSHTTAEYLKASGRGTWQVTTSHTNNSTSILLICPLPPASARHIPRLDGHRLSPYVTRAPNEKLSADEGGWVCMTADVLLPTHIHTGAHVLSLDTQVHCVVCDVLQALSHWNASLAAFTQAFIFAHCSPHFLQFNGCFPLSTIKVLSASWELQPTITAPLSDSNWQQGWRGSSVVLIKRR